MYNLLSNIPLNIDWRQILLHLLNLVILFLILYFLLYNPVKKFMEKRKAHYEEQDEEYAKKLSEAEKQKTSYDELMSRADEEISEKKRAAVADARKESENIIQAAQKQSCIIIQKATNEAEKIKLAAKEQAMEELSESITAAAKEKIEKACSVDRFVSEKGKND